MLKSNKKVQEPPFKCYTDEHRHTHSDVCRLCAQNMQRHKLIDLNQDFDKYRDVKKKLIRLNSEVDFNDDDLPSTVCFDCCASLQDAYEFVLCIDGAQTILSCFKHRSVPVSRAKTDPLNAEQNYNQVFQEYSIKHEPLNSDIQEKCTKIDPLKVEPNYDSDTEDNTSTIDIKDTPILPHISLSGEEYRETCTARKQDGVIEPLLPDGIKVPPPDEDDTATLPHLKLQQEEKVDLNIKNKQDNVIETLLSQSKNSNVKIVPLPGSKNRYVKLLPVGKVPEGQLTPVVRKLSDLNIPNKPIPTPTPLEASTSKDPGIETDTTSQDESNLKTGTPLEAPSSTKANNCPPPMSYKLTYLKHVEKTWKDYKWKCAVCEIEFPTCTELTAHSMEQHDRCNTFSCLDCERKSKALPVFIDHVWKDHRLILKQSCHICFKPFYSIEDKILHQSVHFDTEHVCQGCNTSFKTLEELNDHVNRYFKYNNKCQTTSKFKQLKQYEGKYSGLTCLVCNKTMKSTFTLITHLRMHLGGENSYVCEVCGKVCTWSGALKKHMIHHSDLKPHKCGVCSATFKTRVRLQKHIVSHNKEKRFPCDICGKSFHASIYLRRHRAVHSDDTPFVCTICNRRFRLGQFLRLHMRQHTGVKPYGCDTCDLRFPYYQTYKKHMATLHGIDIKKKPTIEVQC